MNADALRLQQWLDRNAKNTRPDGWPLTAWALLVLKALAADRLSMLGQVRALQKRADDAEAQLAMMVKAALVNDRGAGCRVLESRMNRTPVGVDVRFDQSGRQEVVEQNGNDAAHYFELDRRKEGK